MKLPKQIFGINTEEALRKYLEEARREPPKREETTPPSQITLPSLTAPQEYLHLPPVTHGKHEYGDVYVHLHRLGATSEVTQVCKQHNYTIETTVAENNGHTYVGGLNHSQAMTLVKELKYAPLNLRRGVDFLKELRDGASGRKIVHDAAGNVITPKTLIEVYKEITEVRRPWRAEWFSDRCNTQKKTMRVTYDVVNAQGALEEVTEDLDPYLTRDKAPGIDLDDWLDRATAQGLPPEDVQRGSLHYWCPRADRVGGFGADADRLGLSCDGDPRGSYAAVGVRLSAAGAQKI